MHKPINMNGCEILYQANSQCLHSFTYTYILPIDTRPYMPCHQGIAGTYIRKAPVREKYTYAILQAKKTYSKIILLCATDYACMVKGTKWLKDEA